MLSDSDLSIPDGIGFNARVFSFGFRVADHRLYVEIRNDENQNISIRQARVAFLRIFELARDAAVEELDLFVVSATNALERVLATPSLRQIEMRVDLPNPDILTGVAANLIDFLHEQHAKRLNVGLTKKAGEDSLVLSNGMRELAEVANENGFTRAVGRDDTGKTVHRSTRDYPFEIETYLENAESRAAATRRIAEDSSNV